MPDIAMCHGEGCPLKDKCYRHTAKPDMLQSYFATPPYKDGDCKYFWDDKEKEWTTEMLKSFEELKKKRRDIL